MFLQFIRLFTGTPRDSNVMTSLQLFKYLLRQCERLPPDACKHYKFAVKQVIKCALRFALLVPLDYNENRKNGKS